MNRTTSVQPSGLENAPEIFRHLANAKKWSILQYLATARLATASVIQRRCGIKQPTASRYLRSLTDAGLLVKTCVGYSTIFQINTDTWHMIKNHVSDLSA